MAGKNRLMAKLVASSATITPDSDYIATNLTKTQAQAASLSVYSSINSLPTSAAAGTKALVTSTNTLYIYSNGWYKIAIINAFNPQWITQPDGSYALAIDGSTTSITVLASDSDDVPITYIAVTDSDFDAFATVAHDSDKHNTWTVTPTATTGSYTGTVTFRASDGVNYVQANSSFYISFGVTNSSKTVALIQADHSETDAQVDASSSANTITEVGNVKSGAFSPYHPGGFSVNFDGTGDGLSFGNTSTFKFLHDKTVNYTIEGWIYSRDNSTRRVILTNNTSSGASGVLLENNSGNLRYVIYTGTGGVFTLVDGPAISLNTWHHIAITFDGTSIRTFFDGVLDTANVTTWSISGSTSSHNFVTNIGRDANSVISDFDGLITDLRIVNGSVVYDSDFNVPSQRLTAISGTALLTCHLPYFSDGSTNDYSVTVYGTPFVRRLSPYNYLSYSRTSHGGSVYFYGNGDYLSISDASDFSFGTGDFTWECWINLTAYHATVSALFHLKNDTALATSVLVLEIGSSGQLQLSTGAALVTTGSANDITLYNMHHVAVSRSGTSLKIWLDGKEHASVTNSASYSGSVMQIGAWRYGGYDYSITGEMSDVRIVKGTAVYTSAFTPPIAPLSDITNTTLLTCTNKNNIWDAACGSRITKTGQVTTNSTTRKWTTVDSTYHQGSNDWYSFSSPTPLADDFTVEMWFNHQLWDHTTRGFWDFSGGYGLGRFGSGSSAKLAWWDNNANVYNILVNSEMDALANTWWHFALCRTGGSSYKAFVNGTQEATWTLSGGISQTVRIGNDQVGGDLLGYVQDVRVTNGLARYTTNFTVPSAQFEG